MSGGGFMTSALTAALEERDQFRAEVERLRAELQSLREEWKRDMEEMVRVRSLLGDSNAAWAKERARAQRLAAALRELDAIIEETHGHMSWAELWDCAVERAGEVIETALAEESKP